MSRVAMGQHGGSLAELLVSLAISSMLLLGVFASVQQLRRSSQVVDDLHRLEEQARFVLDMLRADIRLAGFWGLHSEARAVRLGAGATVRCSGTDAGDWALQLQRHIAASNDAWPLPCPPFQNRRQPGTDVLEVRRADQNTSGVDSRALQVLSSRRQAVVFSSSMLPSLDGSTELRDLVVHAWYVSERSSRDSGAPALRRKTLVRGGLLRDEEILSGVEDLQIRLMVDTDRDGFADRVVEPGEAEDASVVAVQFWLLLRSRFPEQGYQDRKIYAYADRDPRSFSDSRRRLLVSGSEMVANAR